VVITHRHIPPVTTTNSNTTYYYGNTNAPAHTWGDIMISRSTKVLFAGDIGFFYVAPVARDGHVTKWLEAIERIMAMDVEVIVPGHGPNWRQEGAGRNGRISAGAQA
jgi:glyoxylase-like metal-dependent hydrolase (beta-lactamase superfamily II)